MKAKLQSMCAGIAVFLLCGLLPSSAPGQNQTITSRIGELQFTHDFTNGYPANDTVEKLNGERDFERAAWFYETVGAGPDMAPKHPGPSSAYLGAYKDKSGDWLDGGRSYRLHVPPDAPAKMFWSVTLYDVGTRSLLVNEQKIADCSSRMDLKKNADGSVDIYCGPTAPAGFEANWIPAVAGRSWFAYFRFYEPTAAYFDKSWLLGDFE